MQTPARSGQIDHARPRGRLSRHVRLAAVASMLAALALPALAGSDALASATGSAASTTAMAKIAAAARVFEASHGNAAAKKKSKKKTKKKPKKAKLCVVKKRNKRGKLVAVYVTKTVTKRVKVGGRFVNRKVRVRVKKMAKCNKGTGSAQPAGVPLTIQLVSPSHATLDFGAFKRTVALTGNFKGFIPGSYVQNQDNQVQLTSGHVSLASTGIFLDDLCNGQVSDSIRTDSASFAEIDQTTTGNAVTLFASGTISGLVHLRIQTALDLRNDDGGCNNPYITTGWTDLTIPLFVKGKLSFDQAAGGLISTLNTGQEVLDNLSACLAPGDPTKPCGGYIIPFPAIFTSTIVGVTTIG